jgi:hypothetical protein
VFVKEEAGVGTVGKKGRRAMAKVIEFYIPKDFRPKAKWGTTSDRGQIIEFAAPKKSA